MDRAVGLIEMPRAVFDDAVALVLAEKEGECADDLAIFKHHIAAAACDIIGHDAAVWGTVAPLRRHRRLRTCSALRRRRVASPHSQTGIFCDPSHIGGKRELVAPLCQQAMDLGFDGLKSCIRTNPDCAWSDAAQQVTPDVLDYILNLLVIRKETQTTENLGELRNQIDDCDNEIIEVLAKRMRVCRAFKKKKNMDK